MAHITLSIDDDVLTAVQKHAVKENTSLDALVGNYLTCLVDFDRRAEEARQWMREMSERAKGGPDEKKWTRDELYDR